MSLRQLVIASMRGIVLVTGLFWAAPSGAAVPTLVQHVAGAMDQNPASALIIHLPNAVQAGNCLIAGVQLHQFGGTTVSVADDKSNTWKAGPTITNNSVMVSLFYVVGAAAGTSRITLTFNGTQPVNPQAVVSEFYNVATASAVDGGSTNASTSPVASGSFTTIAPGDLIYQYGVDATAPGAFNGGSLAPGSNFTLLSADRQVGAVAQYSVQSAAGVITPSFTADPGTDTWASASIALRSAPAGTAPPAGIRIIHVQHWWAGQSLAPETIQFPSSGNLIVGFNTTSLATITSVSDSSQNTYDVSHLHSSPINPDLNTQAFFAPNATTSAGLAMTFNWVSSGGNGDNMIVLYDVTGAAASPFDVATVADGNQIDAGNVTLGSITPTTANGLVFNAAAIDFHTINGVLGTGSVLDSIVNPLDDDYPGTGTANSHLDEDNAYAHFYNVNTNQVSFVYSASTTGVPVFYQGISVWASVTLAFKGSSGGAVTFASFAPKVEIERSHRQTTHAADSFEVEGRGVLGTASDGLAPDAEDVTVSLGSFSMTVPAGSFVRKADEDEDGDETDRLDRKTKYVFTGMIAGVSLKASIELESHRDVRFRFEGRGADLSRVVNPVQVRLAIGDDVGNAVVKARIE